MVTLGANFINFTPSQQRDLGLGSYAEGPIWYHGTSPVAAQRILQQGFRSGRAGEAVLGRGTYFAPRVVAAMYGDVLVAASFDCEIVDWDDLRCEAVQRRVRYPRSYDQARIVTQKSPHLKTRLAEEMVRAGIKAVRRVHTSGYVEVCVYALKTINIIGAFPLGEPVPGEQVGPRTDFDMNGLGPQRSYSLVYQRGS